MVALLRRLGAAVDGHGGAVAGVVEEEAAGDARPELERGEDAHLPGGARLAEEVERHDAGPERAVHVLHPVGAELPPHRHHLVPQRHGAAARDGESPGPQQGDVGAVEADDEVDPGEGGVGLGVGVLGLDGERQLQVQDGARLPVLEALQPRVRDQQVRHLGLVQQVDSEHRGAGDDDADGQQRAQDHHRPHQAGALAPLPLPDPRHPPLPVAVLVLVGRLHLAMAGSSLVVGSRLSAHGSSSLRSSLSVPAGPAGNGGINTLLEEWHWGKAGDRGGGNEGSMALRLGTGRVWYLSPHSLLSPPASSFSEPSNLQAQGASLLA
jgi:hypothetical protein